jgi:16S rRNA processing protein RimM
LPLALPPGFPEASVTAEPAREPWVWLARIRRPQGRKGEVFAEILTDFPEKFAERRQLWLLREKAVAEPRPAELKAHWLHKGGVVLHLAGVDSISDAEGLTGLIVAVPRAERAALGEGEVYIADLIGCTVVDVAAGTPLVVGEIENVDRAAGSAPILIVRSARGEVLIPFAQRYLRKLDLESRRVEMELPDGLVELNAKEGA